MKELQLPQRAMVLSTFDLPDTCQSLVYHCEDCACAVSNNLQDVKQSHLPGVPAADSTHQWVLSQEILEVDLDPNHSVLFNPLGSGGVVVINQLARQILHGFSQPATSSQVLTSWPGEEFMEAFRRLGHWGILQPIGQPLHPSFQTSQVLTTWLHMTNTCNLVCPYCYLNKTGEEMDEATGRAAIETVVRSAIKHDFQAIKLKYAGGEATLNYQLLFKLNHYAHELTTSQGLKLESVILSNGVAFSSRLIRMLKTQGIRVMISLDGIGSDHDVQRPLVNGKPSFHLVDQTITKLREEGYPPHLSITITQRNLQGLPEVVRYALERNLTFSLNFFRDNNCATNLHDLQYEEQAMIQALLEAFAVIKEYLPPWSVLGTVLDRGQLFQPRQRPCGVGQDYVVINQRGQIAKCHMEIEKPLGEVFKADPLLLIRQDTSGVQNLLVDEKEGCSECIWRYWCSGGCPVATYNATGRFNSKSPNCDIYKAIYPETLKLEGLRILKFYKN